MKEIEFWKSDILRSLGIEQNYTDEECIKVFGLPIDEMNKKVNELYKTNPSLFIEQSISPDYANELEEDISRYYPTVKYDDYEPYLIPANFDDLTEEQLNKYARENYGGLDYEDIIPVYLTLDESILINQLS